MVAAFVEKVKEGEVLQGRDILEGRTSGLFLLVFFPVP